METVGTSNTECEVGWDGSSRCSLTLHLNPVPASRPRVTRWGTYYTKTYKTWMAEADKAIPQATYQFAGMIHVVVQLFVSKPRTSKLARPKGDVDNYAKAILDAITKKGYWLDDDEIVRLTVTKEFTDGEGFCSVEITDAP